MIPLTSNAMFWYEVAEAIKRHEDSAVRHLGEKIDSAQRGCCSGANICIYFKEEELILAFSVIKEMK